MSAQELLVAVFVAFAAVGLTVRLLLGVSVRPTGLMLLLAGEAGLLLHILPPAVTKHALAASLAGALAIVVLVAVARLLDRVPRWWLLVAAVAALPFRIPFTVGDESYNLLLPLYVVLAVGGLRLLLDDVRAVREHDEDAPARAWVFPGARMLDVAVAAFAANGCTTAYWSIDDDATAVRLALSWLPFAVLYVLVRAWHGDLRWIGRAGAALAALMAVAAAIGIWQHQTHTIWQNNKVKVANEYAPDFRVNSIFWDPNIFGRYLLLALLAVGVWMVMRRLTRRSAALGGAALVLLVAGLWFTYSQSSFAGLAAAGGMLLLLAVPRRLGLVLAIALAALLATAPLLSPSLSGKDADARSDIAKRGLVLTSYRPVHGVGLGAFEEGIRQVARERGERPPRLLTSHTTPVTVLAEQGGIGLLLYVALLCAAGVCAVTGASAFRARVVDGDERVPVAAVGARWWAAAALAALTAHSMFYAGYFEDPAVWLVLALLASTAGSHERRRG